MPLFWGVWEGYGAFWATPGVLGNFHYVRGFIQIPAGDQGAMSLDYGISPHSGQRGAIRRFRYQGYGHLFQFGENIGLG